MMTKETRIAARDSEKKGKSLGTATLTAPAAPWTAMLAIKIQMEMLTSAPGCDQTSTSDEPTMGTGCPGRGEEMAMRKNKCFKQWLADSESDRDFDAPSTLRIEHQAGGAEGAVTRT